MCVLHLRDVRYYKGLLGIGKPSTGMSIDVQEVVMQIPESVRSLIATGPNAHFVTLNPDGSPQVTVVWVGIENEEFVIGHMGIWQKVKNIRRDPRVVLSMLAPGKNPMALQEYLVIHGN